MVKVKIRPGVSWNRKETVSPQKLRNKGEIPREFWGSATGKRKKRLCISGRIARTECQLGRRLDQIVPSLPRVLFHWSWRAGPDCPIHLLQNYLRG